MSGLRTTLAQLRSLRRKLDGLLEGHRAAAAPFEPAAARGPAELREVSGFGSNPGNLRMLVHAPGRLPAMPPVVVALHGCTQSAAEFDRGTGWSALAGRQGFVVVYPEQRAANNPKTCFSWFQPHDTARSGGEALSIQQMVEHAIRHFGADAGRVYVTGLSAGGAMSSVMLATYPEVFAGGAILAGLPFGAATNVQEAFGAMLSEQVHSPRALGDRIRRASRHRGPWPRISVWHGTTDTVVRPSNAEHIVRQWGDVHGLSHAPARQEAVGGHARRVWCAADGSPVIEAYSIQGMAHGVPLATSLGAEECGRPGPFFHDAGISATRRIAHFWGLADSVAEPIGFAAGTLRTGDTKDEQTGSRPIYDPDGVIAAAFKAAGLSAPAAHGVQGRMDPGAIIDAVLKAARLK